MLYIIKKCLLTSNKHRYNKNFLVSILSLLPIYIFQSKREESGNCQYGLIFLINSSKFMKMFTENQFSMAIQLKITDMSPMTLSFIWLNENLFLILINSDFLKTSLVRKGGPMNTPSILWHTWVLNLSMGPNLARSARFAAFLCERSTVLVQGRHCYALKHECLSWSQTAPGNSTWVRQGLPTLTIHSLKNPVSMLQQFWDFLLMHSVFYIFFLHTLRF